MKFIYFVCEKSGIILKIEAKFFLMYVACFKELEEQSYPFAEKKWEN